MCILIYKPKDSSLPVDAIKEAFKTNGDGAGFITPVTKKEFFFSKGFMTDKELLKALKPFKSCELAIHLRMATHGKVSKENCHPFVIAKTKKPILQGRSASLLMHNGVLAAYGDRENSDSWHFAREALSSLAPHARVRLLDQIQGKFILAQSGRLLLIGLDKDAENGCYFSNKSYKKQIDYNSWQVSRTGNYVNRTNIAEDRKTPQPKQTDLLTGYNSRDFVDGLENWNDEDFVKAWEKY